MIHNRREFAPLQAGVFGVSLAAWIAVIALSQGVGGVLPDFLCSTTQGSWLTASWLASASAGWFLMIAAMMAPMTLPAIAHLRVSTFAARRRRATCLFFLGFVAVWLIPGLAMKALETASLDAAINPLYAAVLAVLLACIWQCSPTKQRCLNGCHRHRPLRVFGLQADLDAMRLGFDHGLWCIGTCWALMLVTFLLPRWHFLVMPFVALLTYCERLDAPRPPAWELRWLRMASLWMRHEIGLAMRSGLLRSKRSAPERNVRGQGLT